MVCFYQACFCRPSYASSDCQGSWFLSVVSRLEQMGDLFTLDGRFVQSPTINDWLWKITNSPRNKDKDVHRLINSLVVRDRISASMLKTLRVNFRFVSSHIPSFNISTRACPMVFHSRLQWRTVVPVWSASLNWQFERFYELTNTEIVSGSISSALLKRSFLNSSKMTLNQSYPSRSIHHPGRIISRLTLVTNSGIA
jgi:hypothetical protein